MEAQKLQRSNTIKDNIRSKGSMASGSGGLHRSQSAEGTLKKLPTQEKNNTFSLTEIRGKIQEAREPTMK